MCEQKISGVDAALDKWKGREERMMSALYKKYDDKIREYDNLEEASNAGKEEL
jgi:hypothetical protein